MRIPGTKFVRNDKIHDIEDFNAEKFDSAYYIYEVIRIIEGIPLFAEKHINRLYHTAKLTNINLNLEYENILQRLHLLITANGFLTGNIKLIIQACADSDSDVEFYAYFIPYYYPSPEEYREGVKVILVEATRTNPNAKQANFNFRNSIDLKLQKAEAFEALLVDSEGFITEGSRSNAFFLKDKVLFCSDPKTILPGITRDIIISLAHNIGLTVREENIKKADLSGIEAVFLSGTSPKVMPINRIDQYSYQSADNSIVKQIMLEFDQVIDTYIKEHKSMFI